MKVKVIGSGSMWNKYNSASYLIDKKNNGRFSKWDM